MVLPTRSRAAQAALAPDYPVDAESWAKYMTEMLGKWEEKFERLGDTVRNATLASNNTTSTAIGDAVQAILNDNEAVGNRVRNYIERRKEGITELSTAFDNIVIELNALSETVEDLKSQVLGLKSAVVETDRQAHILSTTRRDVHAMRRDVRVNDHHIGFLFDVTKKIAEKVGIDIGVLPDALFLVDSPSPTAPPASSRASAGQIEELLLGDNDEDQPMAGSDEQE